MRPAKSVTRAGDFNGLGAILRAGRAWGGEGGGTIGRPPGPAAVEARLGRRAIKGIDGRVTVIR